MHLITNTLTSFLFHPRAHAVKSIQPPSFLPLSLLNQLVAELNKDRDFYGFIRKMRIAFKDEVRVEKMDLGNEKEKESEREKIREERRRG